MKMVKSLLLGTAAGLVAMTGAQAADLPVKAKPVQYVKICSLYGAGFYYIPGTDMCLKVGGWVRAEYAYGDNGNMTWGWANANVNNRATSDSTWRSRGYITADARNQTEYGTVRSYIAVGINTSSTGVDNPSNTFSSNRAFIQFAGFTFGLSQSFFDFYSVPATAFWGSYPASDTGDPGWQVAAYTAQFGGGMSATISAEMRRMTQILNVSPTAVAPFPPSAGNLAPGAELGLGYGGFQMPDIVANLRIDQSWGSAQVMGALHQVNGLYHAPIGLFQSHPDDVWGFAVGAGIKILAPDIGAGDYFQAQVNYAEGASRYVFSTPNSNWGSVNGNSQSFGILSDGVFGGTVPLGTTSQIQLTTAFGINAAYEHFWDSQWRTSVYGGYAEISYNQEANANLCVMMLGGNGNAFTGTAAVATPGCNMDWSTWWIGSRTQYNIDKSTYLGLDILYSTMQSAQTWNGLLTAAVAQGTAAVPMGTVTDTDNWSFRFRVHRDFYP